MSLGAPLLSKLATAVGALVDKHAIVSRSCCFSDCICGVTLLHGFFLLTFVNVCVLREKNGNTSRNGEGLAASAWIFAGITGWRWMSRVSDENSVFEVLVACGGYRFRGCLPFPFPSFLCEFEWWILILEVVLVNGQMWPQTMKGRQIWYVGVETWVRVLLDSYATQRAMNKRRGVDCPRATWLCVVLFNCCPFVKLVSHTMSTDAVTSPTVDTLPSHATDCCHTSCRTARWGIQVQCTRNFRPGIARHIRFTRLA
jgi:hypothetical protein